jgi:tetratricopeptide (TPR) repeat protein
MPVRVPFHLLRRDEADACAGLLLLSTELPDLLDLCGRVGTDPLPPIFPVADGFLIVPEAIPATLPPRTLRLRRIVENLFVPVDADLVPALHADEAADLTRKRALVFLPHDRCLAFDPNRALDAVAILKIPQPKREKWQPFPEGEPLADRLTTITRVEPQGPPLAILDRGGEGIGVEQPRPPKVGPVKSAAGKVGMGIGKGLAALGSALGFGALARLGQKLMGAAMAAVPRLSEALLGKQEAALRELLRKFREGKTDEALRNALPMGGLGSVGGVYQTDQLPTHDTRYSLGGLVAGTGSYSAWLGGEDVQRELMAEYRKAAQEALARGDHRRAAFIYGRLLGDLHTAADVLAKGGLHRDAAILYRDLLSQPRWAAREFEAAGEHDEALRLYREVGDHEEAGDLLRRMGEEEQAIEEYHRAAQKLGEERGDYLRAGELMQRKTGRADLARGYFAAGWGTRDADTTHGNNAIPCANRLAEIDAFAETLDPLCELIDEVEGWLSPPGNVSRSAEFFNGIAKLAELPHLQKHREDLRDRARLALAAKLRDHPRFETRPGNAVSDLFGNSGLWSAGVVADATHALKAAIRRETGKELEERPYSSIRIAEGTVSAAAFAPESGDIIVGFSNGLVRGYQPSTDRITTIAQSGVESIDALAVDATGRLIVAASDHEDDTVVFRAYRRNEANAVQYTAERSFQAPEPGWYHLIPLVDRLHSPTTYVSTAAGLVEFRATRLISFEQHNPSMQTKAPIFLVLRRFDRNAGTIISILVGDREVHWGDTVIPIGWRPGVQENSALSQPLLSWLRTGIDRLEIAGLTEEGVIYWSEITEPTGEEVAEARTYPSRRYEGYCAVTIWKPGRLVGVTAQNRLTWIRAGSIGFQEWAPPLTLPFPAKAVACFPSYAAGEVIVILADGEAVRIPVPA